MKLSRVLDIIARGCGFMLCVAVGASPGLVLAADAILVRGQGVVVTSDYVLADAARIPEELRASILGDPAKVEQLAVNLYVRRVLAKQAREAGLQNDPMVLAAQQLAFDRILSDAFLAKAVAAAASSVNEEALEGLARAAYASGDIKSVTPEERRVSHILIARSVENAKARAEEVLAMLRNGADFAALAKQYSNDPVSSRKGGDLGLFGRGRMVKSFEDAAFGLAKPGDLAGPVETQFGFHILRLEEIRAPGKKPYEEMRDEIKRGVLAKLAEDRRVEIGSAIRSGGFDVDKKAMESFARQEH